jgi:nucleoside-diphosphate-sugar epimerase
LGSIGTVVVTGAGGQVGRALLQSLVTDARTIALTHGVADLPATSIIRGPLDSAPAAAAIRDADYVVHLAGALRPVGRNSYHAANVETTEAVVSALRDAKVRRVLHLSYVGACEDATNAYLRSKAVAEWLLAESGKDVVVFRCTHIIGSRDAPGPLALAMIAEPGKGVTVPGDGRQVVAPVYLGDVVAALKAAMATGSPGMYELAGPDRMTMDDLVRLLNQSWRVPITHIPGWAARILRVVLRTTPGPLVEVMLRDSLGDPSRAVAAFGIELTSLRAIWARREPRRPEARRPAVGTTGRP